MATTLQHPFHPHTLIRTEIDLRGIWNLRCDLCSDGVRGAAYRCDEDCSYFLHEACALVEIPPLIEKHPIHPEHPLVLDSKVYRCDLCDIDHDWSLAIATPTPLEDEGTIPEVFSHHEHPLTAFHIKLPNRIRCTMCDDPISGPAYGCQTCNKFYHEPCARLPAEIRQHPLHSEHPQSPLILGLLKEVECDFCGNRECNSLAYHCEECDIGIHAMCATLLLSLQDQKKEDHVAIHHLSHEHRLLSGHVQELEHIKLCCAACDLKISGQVYYCLDCTFFLHKLCADELSHDMVHYLHPEHHLVLLPKPPYSGGQFSCNCCGKKSSGMAFHCASCKFDLDPKCALQTSSAVRDGIASKIQYFGHDHPLVLRISGFRKCRACQCERSGRLVYSCDDCEYDLHKSCAELPLQLEHPLHSHPLRLVAEDRTCNSCSQGFSGYNFNCPECVFNLCFSCAIDMPTMKHPLHEHALCYVDTFRGEDDLLCISCGEANRIGSTSIYCCKRCNFNVHGRCASLPSAIQHDCHPYHPLVLFDRFVDGLPEYQYCDYCEELRNPDHGVYRCAREECWYTVHIGCVLPQVNFNVHGSCASLPSTIQHGCHPYHPLVLFDRFVDEFLYCHYCGEIRNPDHGVYRCAREECWYTVHIGCVLPQVTQHGNPRLNKLIDEIASLEGTIEVKEKDLVSLKEKLEELKGEKRKILIYHKHDEEV